MGNVDLIASYWTIAGKLNFADGMDLDGSPIDFPQRVKAAIAGGYAGVGLTYPDLKKTVSRYGYDGIRSILRDNGVKIFEVEFLTDWFADGDRRRQSDLIRRELLLAAEKTRRAPHQNRRRHGGKVLADRSGDSILCRIVRRSKECRDERRARNPALVKHP